MNAVVEDELDATMSDPNILQLEDMRREGLVDALEDEIPDGVIPNNEDSTRRSYEDDSFDLDHDIAVMKENPKDKEVLESCSTGIYIDIHHRLEQMPKSDPIRKTLSTIGDDLAELIILLEGIRGDAVKFHSIVKESTILQKNIDVAKGEILKLKAELEEQKKLNDSNAQLLSERIARVIELEGAAKAQSDQLDRVIKERERDKREYELSVDNWKKRCEDSVSKGRMQMTRMIAFTLQIVKEKLKDLGLEGHVNHFESIDPQEEVRKVAGVVRKQRENAQKAGESSSKETDYLAKKRKVTES